MTAALIAAATIIFTIGTAVIWTLTVNHFKRPGR